MRRNARGWIYPNTRSADQRLALIITNQDYSTEIGALSKSHADGEIVGDALRRIGFNVRLVRDSNKADMLGAVSEYADQLQKAGPMGWASFIIPGTAATEKFGDNYLIPVGARIGSQIQLAASGLKLGDVIDILSQTNVQANFRSYRRLPECGVQSVPGPGVV